MAAIAQSGIAAATLKLNASASNTVNANDTSALGASGYLPLGVNNSAVPTGGVVAQAVTLKPGTMVIYDPTASAANERTAIVRRSRSPTSRAGSVAASARHVRAAAPKAAIAATDSVPARRPRS